MPSVWVVGNVVVSAVISYCGHNSKREVGEHLQHNQGFCFITSNIFDYSLNVNPVLILTEEEKKQQMFECLAEITGFYSLQEKKRYKFYRIT